MFGLFQITDLLLFFECKLQNSDIKVLVRKLYKSIGSNVLCKC